MQKIAKWVAAVLAAAIAFNQIVPVPHLQEVATGAALLLHWFHLDQSPS